MDNYRITIDDNNGHRSFVVSAHSKYQALENIATFGLAEVSCRITSDSSDRIADGITGPCSSGFRCSKKLSAYLKSFKDNYITLTI